MNLNELIAACGLTKETLTKNHTVVTDSKGATIAQFYQHDHVTGRSAINYYAAQHCSAIEYVVLTMSGDHVVFVHHDYAMSHARSVRDGGVSCGVYRVVNNGAKPTLGGLNIFCSFDDEYKIKCFFSKQFDFKVI